MLIRIRKAQSTLEYAGLIATVVAAVIVMQIFVKNKLQNRQLEDAKAISEESFDPLNTVTDETVTLVGNRIETSLRDYPGDTTSTSLADYTTARTSDTAYEDSGNFE